MALRSFITFWSAKVAIWSDKYIVIKRYWTPLVTDFKWKKFYWTISSGKCHKCNNCRSNLKFPLHLARYFISMKVLLSANNSTTSPSQLKFPRALTFLVRDTYSCYYGNFLCGGYSQALRSCCWWFAGVFDNVELPSCYSTLEYLSLIRYFRPTLTSLFLLSLFD